MYVMLFTPNIPAKLNQNKVMFDLYRSDQLQVGEPLETEIIYQPIVGIRTCLHCGEINYDTVAVLA